jgi:hypothetical protein
MIGTRAFSRWEVKVWELMGFSGVMAWYCFLDSLILLYTIIVFVLLLSLQSRATIAYVAIVSSLLRVACVIPHALFLVASKNRDHVNLSLLSLQVDQISPSSSSTSTSFLTTKTFCFFFAGRVSSSSSPSSSPSLSPS